MKTERLVVSIAAISIVAAAAVVPIRGGATASYVPTDAERAGRTLTDLRTLGMALEAYRMDNGRYPEGATMDEALAKIEPIYVRVAPVRDAWGTKLRYIATPDQAGYLIVSAGSDARFDEAGWSSSGESRDFAADAVLKNGVLTRSWVCR